MHRRVAEAKIGEAERNRRSDNEPGHDQANRAARCARECAQKVADTLAGSPETESGGVLYSCPHRSDQPRNRHIGDDAQHDQRKQGAQVSASGTREVAAWASAGEHHADAEDETAGNVPEPIEGRCEVHRPFQGHDSGTMQQLCSQQCRCRGQNPRPETAVVVEIVDVAERTHGAIVGSVYDRAEREADQQSAEGQDQ